MQVIIVSIVFTHTPALPHRDKEGLSVRDPGYNPRTIKVCHIYTLCVAG